MNWREILGTKELEIESPEKHPQYPQNSIQPGNSEDCEDKESEFNSPPQPEAAFKTPTHRPQGSALVVVPGWWPEQSFLVVRTEGERDALIEEGESPGIVWTLPEARKLVGLKPDEKQYLASIKVEFNGQIGRVRAVRSGDGP